MKTRVRTFRLHWLNGTTEDITTTRKHAQTVEEALSSAMSEAGIGFGALGALDYWEEIEKADSIEGTPA